MKTSHDMKRALLTGAAGAILLAVIVRCAWVYDDAFITLNFGDDLGRPDFAGGEACGAEREVRSCRRCRAADPAKCLRCSAKTSWPHGVNSNKVALN